MSQYDEMLFTITCRSCNKQFTLDSKTNFETYPLCPSCLETIHSAGFNSGKRLGNIVRALIESLTALRNKKERK